METPKYSKIAISIIIPIYNVGEYLKDCLESILTQNFIESIKVILINDASNDNSGDICQRYAKAHPNIFCYIKNKTNQGVSSSRNIGLECITGKYFTFVDPDDLLTENALSDLYTTAEKHQADIVKGNNTTFNKDGEKLASYSVSKPSIIESKNILPTYFYHNKVRGHTFGKLYLSDKFKNIRFTPKVRMAEDLLYCAEIFSLASKLILINTNVYRYRMRTSGATGQKYISGAYQDWLDSVEKCEKYCFNTSQLSAYKSLQIRTLLQMSKESRHLENKIKFIVLKKVEKVIKHWGITYKSVLTRKSISKKLILKDIVRYTQIKSILKNIK